MSILSLCMFSIINSVKAADIMSGGDCGNLLTYDGVVRKVYYAQYSKDGVLYPAYCLDKTKQGVNDQLSYSVSVEDKIADVGLWRIIINGYPYKTIEELGCQSKEEAFTATKQAIYCYIHGNNRTSYKGIGEAGERTLRALNQILDNAAKCTETQISNTVKIIKENENFQVDEKEKEFVSKIYSIQSKTTITNYQVNLKSSEIELPEGIKITDLNNNPKKEFSSNEKFKILIPIKNLTSEANFNIVVTTKINTKPILYGKAPNSKYQDYALTAATYEDATGNTQDKYEKNETKVKIIKLDKETKEKLENVEFNILDSNKNIIYANLKTNSNGEILVENLIPGKYYLQETSTKEGYVVDDKLLEFDIFLNQELVLTINNIFEKKPSNKNIEKKSITKTVVKKLPITGM